MVTLESQSLPMANSDGGLRHRCGSDGGPGALASSLSRKRSHRRPGYMRSDLPPQLGTTSKGEEADVPSLLNGHHLGVVKAKEAPANCVKTAGLTHSASLPNEVSNKSYGPLKKDKPESSPKLPNQGCSVSFKGSGIFHSLANCSTSPQVSQANDRDTFNSSFSFIQMSLDENLRGALIPAFPSGKSSGQWDAKPTPCTLQSPPLDKTPSDFHRSKKSGSEISERDQSPLRSKAFNKPLPGSQATDLGDILKGAGVMSWTSSFPRASGGVRESPPDSDCCSLDNEATSSLSMDSSDAASASSMTSLTSGYESGTPASESTWDAIMKKYEGVLQGCLQSTRTNTKIESMMLKLQRLQQKAVLDDDYDSAERFRKKLEELRKERASLKPGLPSRHPTVSSLLDQLRTTVNSALKRTKTECRDVAETSGCVETPACPESPHQRKQRLLQEKHLVEAEVQELRSRLAKLQDRSAVLNEQIACEERLQELEEVEGPVLQSCSPANLRQMGRALEDLLSSQHRMHISLAPPPVLQRLQEQEQALGLSIKEATAKVVMSQRLGASLRRKVSESETQLLALHEAKLAAITGNDFSSAKELKVEMRAVYGERDRLEALARKLQALSSGSSQDLARMKEQHTHVKQDVQQRYTQHEKTLKENTAKYIELLEDRLHSCGCPALERVWEADLEACHLILRGLQLRTPSCSGPDGEEAPPIPSQSPIPQACSKAEADCAMLTALGGRWCPEANLQHSEFTKKLEEFLFCLEDSHPEDSCSDVEDVTSQCERISEHLQSLEDQLQMAIDNQDQELTLSLEREVKEVKATLQTMLMQLKDEEEEEEGDVLNHAESDEEEERKREEEEQCPDIPDDVDLDVEDNHYFSDHWEI